MGAPVHHGIVSTVRDPNPSEVVDHGVTSQHRVMHDKIVKEEIEYIQPIKKEHTTYETYIEQQVKSYEVEVPEYVTNTYQTEHIQHHTHYRDEVYEVTEYEPVTR